MMPKFTETCDGEKSEGQCFGRCETQFAVSSLTSTEKELKIPDGSLSKPQASGKKTPGRDKWMTGGS